MTIGKKQNGTGKTHAYATGRRTFLCGESLTGYQLEEGASGKGVTCPVCQKKLLVLGDTE